LYAAGTVHPVRVSVSGAAFDSRLPVPVARPVQVAGMTAFTEALSSATSTVTGLATVGVGRSVAVFGLA
jgi:hypothetical protein